MAGILLKIIEQLNSSVFVLIALLILTMYFIYKAGGWIEKYRQHEKRMDTFETDFKSLARDLHEMTVKVGLIYQNTNPNSTVRSMSPLQLTEIGRDVMENINAQEIFNKYRERLISEVDVSSPQNAYDIQQRAIQVVKTTLPDLLNEDELVKLKQEAFQRGSILEDILIVFGILLRNTILKERNISIADIDKYDPKVS